MYRRLISGTPLAVEVFVEAPGKLQRRPSPFQVLGSNGSLEGTHPEGTQRQRY